MTALNALSASLCRSRATGPDRTYVRFPLAPLERAAGQSTIERAADDTAIATLAARIGVSHRTVYRWKHEGLTQWQADRAAIALGTHPANVWPEWLSGTLTRGCSP